MINVFYELMILIHDCSEHFWEVLFRFKLNWKQILRNFKAGCCSKVLELAKLLFYVRLKKY